MPGLPTLLIAFGTSPKKTKLTSLVLAACAHGGFKVPVRVCIRAQHRELLDSVLGT
jgi:UDP-N-acetylglucosamine 2-epimerase